MSDARLTETSDALRGFPTYSAYTASGIGWLGDHPKHWSRARLGDHVQVVNGFPFDSKDFHMTEGIPLVRIRDILRRETEVRVCGEPVPEAAIGDADILVGMDGDFNVGWWEGGFAMLNQRVCALRGNSTLDQRFLFYLLPFPLKVINDLTYSTTVKHLSSYDVKKIGFAVPAPEEQRAIAAFLDRETAKIDALVGKKRRLVELLEEKRTALISHAVTKGLDPSVPMKDSGIEWVSQVPEHWETLPIRRRAQYIRTGCTPPTHIEQYYVEGSIPWYGPGSFSDELEVGRPSKLINASAVRAGAARLFAPDCVLIVTIGATIGKVGLLVEEGSTNQQITAIRFNPHHALGRFMAYELKTFEHVLRSIAPATTLPILDQQAIGDLPAAFPPPVCTKRSGPIPGQENPGPCTHKAPNWACDPDSE